MSTKIKTFEKLTEFLNEIPDINYGGCAIAAVTMYRWLKSNDKLSEDTEIVYCYKSESNFEFNDKALKSIINDPPESCSHAVLHHNNTYYDSEGDLGNNFVEKYDFTHHIKNESFVIESINNVNYWNPSFEREKEVKKIKKTTGIDLSDIMV